MDTRKIRRVIRQIEKYSNLQEAEIVGLGNFSGLQKVSVLECEFLIKKMISLEMGKAELSGLSALRDLTKNVPQAHGPFEDDGEVFIVLEYIEPSISKDSLSICKTMKSVYSQKGNYWGWDSDNFVGSLKQTNSKHEDFLSYFMQDRIEPLIRLTYNSHLIDLSLKNRIESLVSSKSSEWGLGKIFPRLIHGDLWSGNIIQSKNGNAYLIDPSVSYGHPEQDFAMSLLFGGTPTQWIESIREDLELEEGFSERISFWQIYPLLVHVVLFGGGYVEALKRAVYSY